MAEITGSNLEEPALNQVEQVTLIADHLWALWSLVNGAEDYTPTPPVAPVNGQLWLIGAAATGIWTGKAQQVAIYIAGGFHYLDAPQEGWKVWVKDVNFYYRYNGSVWILDDPDKVYQTVVSGDTPTVDWSLGSTAYCLLDRATTTFTFTGGYNGQRCVLVLEQDGTGGRAAAFGAECRAGTDTPLPPVLSAGLGEVDYMGFVLNGTDSKYDHVSLSKGLSA